jgi:ABC-type dipeptide/oligopeptide/nickel transport system ATPase component
LAAAKNLVGLGEEEWRRVRGREIAMIFQEPMTSLNPVMRVGKFVEFGPAKLVLDRPEAGYTKELLAAVPEIPHAGQV